MAKILIVDDDKDILKFTDALLSQAGHEVRVATEALSAIDLITNRSFDLIITDANMPHYTGFELIKTIRKDPRYRDVGIAMLTGLREKESIEKAIKAGVDDYIVKPIDPMIFVRKIDDLLKKKPPRKQMEITFSAVSDQAKANLSVDAKIATISETFLKIHLPFDLPVGALVNLQTGLFAKLEINTPPLRVMASEKHDDEFVISLAYVGLSEVDLEKIRSWLHMETNKRKVKSA